MHTVQDSVLVKYIDILVDRLRILQCLVDRKSVFYCSCPKHMFDLVGFFKKLQLFLFLAKVVYKLTYYEWN